MTYWHSKQSEAHGPCSDSGALHRMAGCLHTMVCWARGVPDPETPRRQILGSALS